MKYILAFALCISNVAYAQTRTTEGTGSTKMNSSNTVNDSANKGKSSQKSGSGANQMAGTALMMLCMMGCSNVHKYACYACPLAGMALSQAMSDSGAADQSGKTYDASLNGGDYSVAGLDGSGYTPEGYKDTSGTKTAATIKENLDKLKAMGYTVNPDGTVTTPDGKTVSSGTFSSAGAMAGAGYSPSEISAAQSTLDKLNKKIAEEFGGGNVVAVAVDSSGGGGGGSSGSYEKDTSFDDYLKSLRRGGSSTADIQRAVAGKVVVIDGQSYGVKGDNIFAMVAREYSERRDHQGFLGPVPAPKK